MMMMNGFNTNFDAEGNQVYAVNTVAFHYVNEPIRVKRNELVRIYLVNILEYDPINSFHIHANFFDYYPTGTRLEPTEFTDTIIQGQAQRGILELRFPHAGQLHVPRPQDRVRRARLDGLLRGRRLMEAQSAAAPAPLAVAARRRPAGDHRRRDRDLRRARRPGPRGAHAARRSRSSPSRRRSCGRARSSSRSATPGPTRSRSARSSWPTPTSTSRLPTASSAGSSRATLTLDYPWQEGSPYAITIVTSTGATIDHDDRRRGRDPGRRRRASSG